MHVLVAAEPGSENPVRLPSDVVVGDLVVVPCTGATFLRDVAVE